MEDFHSSSVTLVPKFDIAIARLGCRATTLWSVETAMHGENLHKARKHSYLVHDACKSVYTFPDYRYMALDKSA